MTKLPQQSDIVLFRTTDEKISISVVMEHETVWLTQAQMGELFDKSKGTISEHISHIFSEGELDPDGVVRKFRTTATDGKNYDVEYYNLDVIISVGYRVKSLRGTEFRKWATERLREYIIKGFTMNDERLKENGGGNYWTELLDRIRDIRSSEKVLYRQVLDLYATSIDYDPHNPESQKFFATVQNKLHYAVNKHTAAETIYERADAEKEFMGLTTFSGAIPTKKDIVIAKNYLDQDELFRLNRLVSAFFDLAEIKAQEQVSMKMSDWVTQLDQFVTMYGKGALENAGVISHEKALEKAEQEYKKYQTHTLSPVEKDYLESIRDLQKKVEKSSKK